MEGTIGKVNSGGLVGTLYVLFDYFVVFSASFTTRTRSISSLGDRGRGVRSGLRRRRGGLSTLRSGVSGGRACIGRLIGGISLLRSGLSGLRSDGATVRDRVGSIRDSVSGARTRVSTTRGRVRTGRGRFRDVCRRCYRHLHTVCVSNGISALRILLRDNSVDSILAHSRVIGYISGRSGTALSALVGGVRRVRGRGRTVRGSGLGLRRSGGALARHGTSLRTSVGSCGSSGRRLSTRISGTGSTVGDLGDSGTRVRRTVSTGRGRVGRVSTSVDTTLGSDDTGGPNGGGCAPNANRLNCPADCRSVSTKCPGCDDNECRNNISFPYPINATIRTTSSNIIIVTGDLGCDCNRCVIVSRNGKLSALCTRGDALYMDINRDISGKRIVTCSNRANGTANPRYRFRIHGGNAHIGPVDCLWGLVI